MASTNRSSEKGRQSPALRETLLRADTVVGALIAVAIVVGGMALLESRPSRWSARASVLVLPVKDAVPAVEASYYNTLSQGQVVASLAEVFRLRRFQSGAADRLMLSASDRRHVELNISVVPGTAVITIRTTANQKWIAEEFTNAVLDDSLAYAAGLGQPYRLDVLSRADRSGERDGLRTRDFAVVIALVALAIGVAVQQAVRQLTVARSRPDGLIAASGPPRLAVSPWNAPDLFSAEESAASDPFPSSP